MDDADENAAMVNALQRHATVIVQKSLAEGFGLTVAEGLWKAKAVVASAVGGVVDRVVPGTGVLLDDPTTSAHSATPWYRCSIDLKKQCVWARMPDAMSWKPSRATSTSCITAH
jgi:glycosyltransferase involved in cell wall biosynthesis